MVISFGSALVGHMPMTAPVVSVALGASAAEKMGHGLESRKIGRGIEVCARMVQNLASTFLVCSLAFYFAPSGSFIRLGAAIFGMVCVLTPLVSAILPTLARKWQLDEFANRIDEADATLDASVKTMIKATNVIVSVVAACMSFQWLITQL